MADSPRFREALQRIDALNARDPNREPDGNVERPKELLYSERMSAWLEKLVPDASEALRLAVRAQHVERWKSPRDAYPADRAGYRAWRVAAARRHAQTAGEILHDVGYDDSVVERVGSLIHKERLKTDPEAQALEDAACLVFLEHYAAEFSEGRGDEELGRILTRTWAKMSDQGREAALRLALPVRLRRLIEAALSG